MGWVSFHLNEPVKDWFKREYQNGDYEVLDVSVVKYTKLYAAVREKSTNKVYCVIYLLSWTPKSYYNFAYKGMDEFAGPYFHDCPERIFKQLSPLTDEDDVNGWAREWRKRVIKYKNDIKKLKTCYVKLNTPVKFRSGAEYDCFKRYNNKFYGGWIEDGKFASKCWVSFNPLTYTDNYELIEE